ncbi:hypothetical protein BS50DRAFT_140667 [Corynespora cassiicola Philippines]|uniref:Uncharacterized protein n=1 Tax=Corynespora cassiicola Philippines TaxID=1448308 RepID=A0A2T2N9W4_CORCC|nr:hypothetical protein BS50DRAFT_140667 [Corynespora cassiicola Philippines]
MAARSGQDTPPNSTPTCADAASTTSRGLDATVHGCSSLPSARHRSWHQTADDLGFLGIEEFAVLPCHDTPRPLPLGCLASWPAEPARGASTSPSLSWPPVDPYAAVYVQPFVIAKYRLPAPYHSRKSAQLAACAAPNVLIWLVLRLIPGLMWEVGDPVRTSVKSLGEKN